jgi:hypothetical protein
MANVQVPYMPDIESKATNDDPQLKELLLSIKLTLNILTGADPNSNTALIDLLNDNQ